MRTVLVMTAVAVFGSAAATDPPAAGTVSARGTAELKQVPDRLRVQFDVLVRGKTLKDALDNLKTRREEVRAGLVKIGAAKEAVRFDDPTVVGEASDRQSQVERMMMQRDRALGKKEKPKADPPAVVSVSVRADFSLPTGATEDRLVAAKGLQDKLKAANLGGLKVTGKVTPEEEEAIEEAIPRAGRPGDDRESDPGAPTFLFVAKVPEAERTKALAAAFANAKKDAERLAKAAGAGLGALHHLADQFQPDFDPDDFRMMGRRGYYGDFREAMGGGWSSGEEAVGSHAGAVKVKVGVEVQFKLLSESK